MTFSVRKLISAVSELVFPSSIYCISCGNLIDSSRHYALCNRCMEEIHWANQRVCGKCGKVLTGDEDRELCSDCVENHHSFTRGFTCMVYQSLEKEMLHTYKFNGAAYMGEKLGEILLDRIRPEVEFGDINVDMVTSVPMSKSKLKKRGYNQSELMAKVVARGLGLLYNNRVLVRKSQKKAMNKLSRQQRMENVMEAYALGSDQRELAKIKDKSVLLIDDIYTTGATVDACSDLLFQAGASQVYVLTLAAGAD